MGSHDKLPPDSKGVPLNVLFEILAGILARRQNKISYYACVDKMKPLISVESGYRIEEERRACVWYIRIIWKK